MRISGIIGSKICISATLTQIKKAAFNDAAFSLVSMKIIS